MGSARLAARLARLVSLALVCIASPGFAQVSGDGAEVTLYVPLVKEAGAPFVVTMNSSVPVEGFQFQLVTSNNGVDVEINNVTSLSSLGIINSTSASDTNNTIIVYDLSQNSPIPPGDDIQLVNLTFSTSSPLEPPYQISLEGVSFSKLDGSGKPTSASVEEVYEELPQVAIKISAGSSPDAFSILVRSSNQTTSFFIPLADQDGNEINGMSIAPGGIAPPNVLGGAPTIGPGEEGKIEIVGNAMDSPIPPQEEFIAFINIQLTEEIPTQVCFGNVKFFDSSSQVGLVQLILTSIEPGKNSFTISINSTISIAGFTIAIETSADSGITIADIMENTPSGFTVSANDNLIVGFSTSEVIISPTAPEITPLMTVLLSEDNIAVEVCVGSAEFDSPDGEAAEVEIICAISPESPATTDTDITIFANATDASGNIAVYFQSSVPVSGFQFRLTLSDGSPAPINETVAGGIASELFEVFVGQDTGEVVALSIVGQTITAQPTATLLVKVGSNPPIPQGTEICIENPVFTDNDLNEFPVTALCSGNVAAVLSPSPPISMQEGKQSEIFLVPIDLNERRFGIFVITDAFLKTFRTIIRLSDGSDVTAFSFDSVRDGYEASKTQNELLIENNDSSKLFTGALAGKIIELVFEDESIVPSEIVLDEVVIGDPLGFSIDLVEANVDLAVTLDMRASNVSSMLDVFVVSTIPLTGFKLSFAKADADDVDVQVSGFQLGTESALEIVMPEESPGLVLGYSPFGNTIPVQHVSSLFISVQVKGVENNTQVCIEDNTFTDSAGAPTNIFILSQCATVHIDSGDENEGQSGDDGSGDEESGDDGSGDEESGDQGDKKKFPVVLEVILIVVGSTLVIFFSVILLRISKNEKKQLRKKMKLFKDEDATNEPSSI